MCAVSGIFFAKIFLNDLSQEVAISLVSIIMLVLSFTIAIGSINLLKAFFEIHYFSKQNDN